MNLYVPATLLAGTSFKSAAAEMQAAANRLGVGISADFNEVKMSAAPGGSAEWLEINAFARRLKPRPHYNGAHSNSEPSEEDRSLVFSAYAKQREAATIASREFLEATKPDNLQKTSQQGERT